MAKKKAARKTSSAKTTDKKPMLFPAAFIGHPDARALEAAAIIVMTAAVNRLVNRYWEIAAAHVGRRTRARKATRRKGKR